MTIFIRTSGGGGIVLIVALALIFGHGSGISGVAVAVLLGLVVAVVAAILVTLAVLVRRLLPPRYASPHTVIRVAPEISEQLTDLPAGIRHGVTDLPAVPRPLDAPVRLHPDQLAELAEILRRSQRPEQ